ncbi:ras GEF [Annulohypoxylon maeteangense]|uniref:ras GEF n=1 Tax=Annulohypoxylon maeteangense TaxID=1927788 RepID=UPI0020079FF2|nr:ras GEF [Annulohypoxylon maeteangense]KAI0884910.1 ras GEF [Annulohypoxylon maeteangense]
MMLDDQPMRASLQVAPLTINKSRTENAAKDSDDGSESAASTNPYSQSQITPPSTPNDSQEELIPQPTPSNPIFHNFLRAFYPFHPTYAMTDSTVTLPLNEGDVVLVHSIHTNGWADGTLLVSGARGWLPTNYCEAYDPDEMRNLLNALLNFWDLLRSTATNDRDIFGNQEFMKGIIAGVRYLLERTHCLTRESATVQRSESLRRGRKSLLSELSSLVKTAKRLQETLRGLTQSADDVNDIIDEMILKAFKIVVKGVRFLDLIEEDRQLRAPAVTVMATVVEESFVPPTPPLESTAFENGQAEDQSASSRADIEAGPTKGLAPPVTEGVQTSESANKRLSCVYSSGNAANNRMSQMNPLQGNRLSASISHRVSLAGPSPLSQSQKLVSERLNSCHDTFLSHLGSFIGRLHVQSQSRPELALAIKHSVISGGQLFSVVDAICDHNTSVSETLGQSRVAMYDRIRDLVYSAREILGNRGPDGEDLIIPQDNSRLLLAATGCVKAAGECVAKTKWVLERIGDFEFEVENGNLDIDLGVFEAVSESRPRTPAESTISEAKTSEPSPRPTHSVHLSMDKPLPDVPVNDSTEGHPSTEQHTSPPASRPQSMITDDAASSMASSVSSLRPSLPALPRLTTSLSVDEPYSPATETSHDGEYHSSFRSDTGTASSSGSNSTYLSRDSEASMVSDTSTRATTPDHSLVPKTQPSLSDMSTTASSSVSEEVDELESKLLEKTFAHELMFNKEGQVTGGSLPALVERLTTHEATPDAMFVSAFYLTFRLFCSPTALVETLIERFDYVGENSSTASPVRLRVYNVLKGWLESHWRDSTDREALPLIQHFAEFKLGSLLPSAGKRIMELSQRVSSTDGSLVPRLVSSMGKTNTSISQFVPVDTPMPNPALSKSQHGLLNNWKSGGSCPSFLDFEPLEVARQLTLKQMSIFCSIMPEELLGSQWMKKNGASSPNVKAMSSFSTDLSNLVADTILQYPEVKKRAVVIKQWIKIAHQCLELNNYDGLMSIVCSLNNSIISRLRKTWDLVSPKRREMLKSLQAVVEPANNNKVLRARLQGHVPPCLPFLGMFLTDLTFVDIGNPPTKQLPSAGATDSGLTVINFDKHTRTAKIIGELQRFQIPYRLTEIPDMQEWIQAQVTRVKELDQGNVQVSYYRKSLLLEPRENLLKTPIDGTVTTPAGQKADLFSWMSRDRHHNNNTVST